MPLSSFTDPIKQSLKLKSFFKSHDSVSNSYTTNKFTTMFVIKDALSSCFKQLLLNFSLSLEIFYIIFGERLYFLYKKVSIFI